MSVFGRRYDRPGNRTFRLGRETPETSPPRGCCRISPGMAQPIRPRGAPPAGRDPMTGPARAAAVSPARAVAYAVLRRVFEQDAWADRVLHAEAGRARLDARDRALATQLAYGSVQRAATLDHVIAAFARRPVETARPAAARRPAPRRLPARVPGRHRRPRRGRRVGRAGQGRRPARRRAGQRGPAPHRPRGPGARGGAARADGGRGRAAALLSALAGRALVRGARRRTPPAR